MAIIFKCNAEILIAVDNYQFKQNYCHFHCIGVEAEISETHISKPRQINQNYLHGEMLLDAVGELTL